MKLSKWVRSIFAKSQQPIRRERPRTILMVEELETRIVPIVGAFASAPVVMPGQGFDGVVRIDNAFNFGTGTLLTTPGYVLTAAHVLGLDAANPFPAAQVTFRLARPNPNVPGAMINVEIPITVPANDRNGNTFQLVPGGPGYTLPNGGPVWDRTNFADNDIALLRLVDQVDPKPDRLLVAPKGATGFAPYAGVDEAGKQFTQVGYGFDGTGTEGNNADEVQTITITNIPAANAAPGKFVLAFYSTNFSTLTGDLLTNNLSAKIIAQEANLGANVNVAEIPSGAANARTFRVRFVKGLGERNIQQIDVFSQEGGGGFHVEAGTLFNGSNTGGVKRTGMNRFDVVDPLNSTALLYDFDDGTDAHDANSLKELGGPNTGLGASEAFASEGDSGSPLFLKPDMNSPFQIAGVMFAISSTPQRDKDGNVVKISDIRNYVDSNDKERPDSSFGEVGGVTRVSSFIDNFIKPATAGKYRIVLDMNQQLLGHDGVKENLTITALVSGADLVLRVDGSAANDFNGEYFRQPLANITSLTIRTNGADNYTVVKDANLNILVTEQVVQNRAPVAKPDTALTEVNTPVKIHVLANDSDRDSDTITLTGKFSGINTSSGEKAVVNDNGTPGFSFDDFIDYTPPTNVVGTRSLSYQISDGNGHLLFGSFKVTVSPDGLLLAPTVNSQSKTTLVFTKETDDAREMGLFLTDGADGHIGNFMPGDAGYTAAALARKQVLFAAGAPANSTTSVQLSAGKFYGFYAGQGSELVFSINRANAGGQDRFQRNILDGLDSELTLTGDAFVARMLAEIVQ